MAHTPKKPYKQRGRPDRNPKKLRVERMLVRGVRRDGTSPESLPQHERPKNVGMKPPQAGLA